MRRSFLAALLFLLPWAASAPAQPPASAPTSTFVGAVLAYPSWFHLRQVNVCGTLRVVNDVWWLDADDGQRVRVVAPDGSVSGSRVAVLADVYDVGRLAQGDARLSAPAVQRVLLRAGLDGWPRPGALILLRIERTTSLRPSIQPSIEAIVLEHDRYVGKEVVVVGQFRGANLLDDLPAAPGHDRREFVLRSGGASVWVSGLRPRVNNVDLNVRSRAEVDRWFAVQGTVRRSRSLIWIEGRRMAFAPVPKQQRPAAPLRPEQMVPADVMFSVPVDGDTDVPTGTSVRIQFSRPVAPATFDGHIRVSYVGDPPSTPPPFVLAYAPADRVLTIRFRAPLLRFRQVVIELDAGALTPDGSPVAPWRLQFATGS